MNPCAVIRFELRAPFSLFASFPWLVKVSGRFEPVSSSFWDPLFWSGR